MRSDDVGDTARKVGNAASGLFGNLKKFNEKHNITGKTYAAAKASIAKAQEVNKEYGITNKVESAAVRTARAASEVNEKYKVTDQVGAALGAGLDKVTKLVDGTTPDEIQEAEQANAKALKD